MARRALGAPRTINRITLRKQYRYNQVGGARRTHYTGRMVHTFMLPSGALHLITANYSVVVTAYMPGLLPSYVGNTPLANNWY